MRPLIQTFAILMAAATLSACGHAGAPTALKPVGAQPARLQPSVQARPSVSVQPQSARPGAAIVANNAGNIVSNNAGNIVSNAGAGLVNHDLSFMYEDSTPPASPADEAAEDARLAAVAQAAAEAPPPYNIDDRMPYGVVVAERSATTVTIAWRTNVPTKGLIEFAKTRDFKGIPLLRIQPKGFTDRVTDDVAKTDHKYTITGLSRFTSYTFKVSGVSALGLTFGEKERPFRTKFWALR